MRQSILFLVYLTVCQTLFSQQANDSVPPIEKNDYSFSANQLIVPVSLIALGSFGISNGYLQSVNKDIKDELARYRTKQIYIDDYIQYAPVVSVYGLSLAGIKAKHDYADRTLIVATSYLTMGIMVNALKYTVHEPRPDSQAPNSFQSGHAATAFMGAELVRIEYGNTAPICAVLGYTTAVGVGFLRVYNERHWTNDIIAGAGFGILSARIGYWLLPLNRKIFGRDKQKTKNTSQITIVPYYMEKHGGISLSYHF